MDTQTITTTLYDEDGNLVETETVEVPLSPQQVQRREAIAKYRRERAAASEGNLSMAQLRARLDALEELVATLVPHIKED